MWRESRLHVLYKQRRFTLSHIDSYPVTRSVSIPVFFVPFPNILFFTPPVAGRRWEGKYWLKADLWEKIVDMKSCTVTIGYFFIL